MKKLAFLMVTAVMGMAVASCNDTKSNGAEGEDSLQGDTVCACDSGCLDSTAAVTPDSAAEDQQAL